MLEDKYPVPDHHHAMDVTEGLFELARDCWKDLCIEALLRRRGLVPMKLKFGGGMRSKGQEAAHARQVRNSLLRSIVHLPD